MPSVDLSTTLAIPGGIVGRLRREAQAYQDRTALVGNRRCRFPRLSYAELFRLVERLAAGLLAKGIKPGDKVGIVSENLDLWILFDLALLSIGAVDVPRGGDASAEEIQFVMRHSGCRAVLVEGAEQLAKLGPLRHELSPIIVFDDTALKDGLLGIEALLELGDRALSEDKELVQRCTAAIQSDALATIIYTSGTTGDPKGAMLQHGNILHHLHVVPDILHLKPGMRFLSFLPTWHVFERALEYVVLDRGMELHYSSKWTLKQDFPRVAPEFVAAVPRVWEGFCAAIEAGLQAKGGVIRAVVNTALEGSRVHNHTKRSLRGHLINGKVAPKRPNFGQRIAGYCTLAITALPHLLADRLVYSKVKKATGGAIKVGISGGGPLPDYVDEFLNRAGIPLLNGYGLTETSPVLSVRVPERNILGTIGRPLPYTQIRIVSETGQVLGPGETGVIQAKGPQVMVGYHSNPSATARALSSDGWFDTGDLGALGAAGDLAITGRAKDTIVLRGGENVEPEPLEATLLRSPLIADALLVGHGQKMLGALLVPAGDALRKALNTEDDDATLARREDVRLKLKAEIGRLIAKSEGYRNFELVGPFAILDEPFSVETGTLTATMKKRRRAIEERHQSLIASLYA